MFFYKDSFVDIPGKGSIQAILIIVAVGATVLFRINLLYVNSRQFSVALINQTISTSITIIFSYIGLFGIWCIFWKRLYIRKKPLYGIWQILPWTSLLALIPFLYMGTMLQGLNTISIFVKITFMVFVVWIFKFQNEWIKYLCGAIGFAIGALTFLLTGENFIVFMIFYILMFIIIVTITSNSNSVVTKLQNNKINLINIVIVNKLSTIITTTLLIFSIVIIGLPVSEPKQLCLNEFTNVTEQFIGETITIRSMAERTGAYNNFMSANFDYGGIVRFNRVVPGSWERFYVSASSGRNWVSLRAHNGRYISVQHHRQHAPLIAEANTASLWEEFRILERNGNHYLFARMHSIFISASIDKGHIPAEARYPNRLPGRYETLLIEIVQ